jgi:hypothetical protein
VVDDAQWLDHASAGVLGFVARRLVAESVLLPVAVREPGDERLFPALPELALTGLAEEDGRALLAAAVPGQLDAQVCDRLVAETRGNPLALLELARSMSQAELAGGFAVPTTAIVSGQLQSQLHQHYLRRVRTLPEPTQRLMVLAAADPTGDTTLLSRAAGTTLSVCWPRPRAPPSTISSGPAWSSCEERSTPHPVPGGRHRPGCCGPPSGSNRWIFGSPETPILTRCSQPLSLVGWHNPAVICARCEGGTSAGVTRARSTAVGSVARRPGDDDH